MKVYLADVDGEYDVFDTERKALDYFQLMGPEGIRLATYQLTANSESASQ